MVMRLNLRQAAESIAKEPVLDLPGLLSDRALENSSAALAQQAASELIVGFAPQVEFVPMPKPGFGHRPLAVLDPVTRVTLEALAEVNSEALPAPTRGKGKYESFERLGTSDSTAVLFDFDIAACYEFIDHEVLAAELLAQGGNADTVI